MNPCFARLLRVSTGAHVRLTCCLTLFACLHATAAQAQVVKLLLSDVVSVPGDAEAIAIHNPGTQTVSLANYYLADYADYWQIVNGGLPSSTDFLVRFPANASIAPGGTQVVSIAGATSFAVAFAIFPTYEIPGDNPLVPDMVSPYAGAIGTLRGLTNGGEPIVLFYWDGTTNRVTDVDYVFYGLSTATNPGVNKTGVVVGGDAYAADTPDDNTRHASVLAGTICTSTSRADYGETGQVASGGNGVGGRDETSENNSATWSGLPSPAFLNPIFRDGFE